MDKKIVLAVSALVLVLQIVAIAVPYWSYKSAGGNKMHMGLWKACNNASSSGSTCIDIPPEGDPNFPKNSVYACRAFSILGAFLIFGSVVCLLYSPEMRKCSYAMMAVGGIMAIIAAVIWALDVLKLKSSDGSQVTLNPSFAWYFTLFGGVGALGLGAYCLWKVY